MTLWETVYAYCLTRYTIITALIPDIMRKKIFHFWTLPVHSLDNGERIGNYIGLNGGKNKLTTDMLMVVIITNRNGDPSLTVFKIIPSSVLKLIEVHMVQ